jgi:hypothetical protein
MKAQADVMLSGLRSAGAVGMTRGQLFDVGIGNPSYLADQLRERGHGLTETTEEINGGVTSRFTLMVDADEQRPMFEGDATGQLGTWKEEPVQTDELLRREAALAKVRA